jgi:hypothetical protein
MVRVKGKEAFVVVERLDTERIKARGQNEKHDERDENEERKAEAIVALRRIGEVR